MIPKDQLYDLFKDPRYKFYGSLNDAKKKAIEENKWILVNMQDAETFSPFCFKCGAWKDEDLIPLIRESYIFYQYSMGYYLNFSSK